MALTSKLLQTCGATAFSGRSQPLPSPQGAAPARLHVSAASPHTLQGSHTAVCLHEAARPSTGSRPLLVCAAKTAKSEGNFNVNVDPAYIEGASYLKTIGYTNPAEIARILDVAMNPGSMFADYRSGKRASNASARLLSVQDDMEPVVNYLLSKKISKGDLMKVISGHPAVLSYSIEQRLEPFWKYLGSLGVQEEGIASAVVARPSLLGLEVNVNLEKIVDYLQYIETPPDQIVKFILESI